MSLMTLRSGYLLLWLGNRTPKECLTCAVINTQSFRVQLIQEDGHIQLY